MISKIINSFPKTIIASTMVTMGTTGLCHGYKQAKKTCFIKEDLTFTENIGEYFCFTTIVGINGIMFFTLTPLILSTTPLSLPYITSKLLTN